MYRSFLEYLGNHDDQHQYGEYWGNQGAGVLTRAKDTGRWLVALRGPGTPQPLTWAVVGGKTEPGEFPRQTAAREFREETGFAGSVRLRELYRWRSPRSPFIYHTFLGETPTEWEPQLTAETAAFRWCRLDELLALSPKHFGLVALLENTLETLKEMSCES